MISQIQEAILSSKCNFSVLLVPYVDTDPVKLDSVERGFNLQNQDKFVKSKRPV